MCIRFLALGQFAKVRQALSLPVTSTPNTLERKTAELCRLPWHEIQAGLKSGLYQPFGKVKMSLKLYK